MPFSPSFLNNFAVVLSDAKARAPQEPLSVDIVKGWNQRALEAVAPERAGEFRTTDRTVRWLGRNRSHDYYPVEVAGYPAAKAVDRVAGAYDRFERGLPSAVSNGDVATALAWPVIATLEAQPFDVGNLVIAPIVLSFAAKRAGLELSRIDWSDPDLRYRIYLGLKPGSAGAGALADYLRPRLGQQESAEGAKATHIVDLDKVGQDGGHGSNATTPPPKHKHRGGGPRKVRRAGRQPPLPPPEATDYP